MRWDGNPEGMNENSPAFSRRESLRERMSPEGTAEAGECGSFSRPFGTGFSLLRLPALKRRAILTLSLRDGFFRCAAAAAARGRRNRGEHGEDVCGALVGGRQPGADAEF